MERAGPGCATGSTPFSGETAEEGAEMKAARKMAVPGRASTFRFIRAPPERASARGADADNPVVQGGNGKFRLLEFQAAAE